MKNFDYYKFKDELNKACERLYADLYHDTENAIKVLRTEEAHIQEVTSRLEEAINELEWFTCE